MTKSLLLSFFAGLLMICACESASSNSAKTKDSTAPAKELTPQPAESTKTKKKNILFFGNSLTAAYGLDPSEGFAGLIDQRLDSLGLSYRAINAGLSGETTAGGLSRIDWIIDQQAIDIFILELGGNDGLRGLDPVDSKKNLQGIIDKVRSRFPEVKIVLAGMEAPPNMGEQYTRQFRSMYPELAKENKTALIPFLLEDVGGIPELNQRDGIHPTAKGHRIVAENIWEVLAPLLKT